MERTLSTLLPNFVDLPVRSPSELYPECCRWNEIPEGAGEPLDPAEELILSPQAAPSVLALFKAGRSAARKGMSQLNITPQAILRNDDRSPAWPEGMVGSITHTKDIAMAVVASNVSIRGLGIDIESIHRSVNLNLAQKMAQPSEAQWIETIHGSEHCQWRLLRLLSAKEAIFKTFYPLNHIYLGFLDVELTPHENGFSGTLQKSCSPHWPAGSSFDVLQSVWKGYLVSACWIST